MIREVRGLLSSTSIVASVAASVVACGGPAQPPASSPRAEGSSEGQAGPRDPSDGSAAPRAVSRYPEPFLEPDCTSVPTDGYLPDAKKVVAEVRRKHWDQLKACAEAAPEGEAFHGEIRTSFRLDPDGVPRCVEAPGASITHREVVNCVLAIYRSFRFPAPKNGSVRISDGIHLDVSHDDE
jgi:hypothetical protein